MVRFTLLLFLLLVASSAYGASDLEINSLKATPTDKPREMQVILRFVNHGPENADHVACNVYVYANQKLLVTQNFPLKPAPVGLSRDESFTIQLPAESATAIKAEIYDAQEPDVQPSTNFTQVNIKPPDYKHADLQIVESTLETTQPLLDKAMLNLKIRNNGPDNIPYSKLTVDLLVYDQNISAAERRIQRMAAGEEAEFKIGLSIAKSFRGTEGIMDVKWTTPDADVQDPAPANNEARLPVQVVSRLPDLVPQAINIDRRGLLTFGIANKGNIRSGASVTALYINGALVQRFATPELPPTGTQRFQYTAAKIPADTMISIVCDFNADVEEASEENNRLNYKSK
jgi:hypothetical protein